MPLYDLPHRPAHDTEAESREQQDARIRARMSRSAFLAGVQAAFAHELRTTDTPLKELVTMMFEAPIRDLYDHRAFLNSQLRDAKRLGQALLKIVADVSLEHYQGAADEESF
jgi:signal transduction histidine kinase